MAFKFRLFRVKQTGLLAAYFSLLLYTLSGLMFQVSVWLLVGALSWFGILSTFLSSKIYRYYTKRLKEISIKDERSKRENWD